MIGTFYFYEPSAGHGLRHALAGLTPVASRLISVPRVGESPVSFECRLSQIIQLKTVGGGAVQTWLTLGQVVGVHISDSLLKGREYDTAAARPFLPVGRAEDYFEIAPDNLFRMTRAR
jgi:flavin reductase (DIM6/NTAB) family NADH-FMN oxidoreductase RutF